MVQLLCHQLLCFQFSLVDKTTNLPLIISSSNQVNYTYKLVEILSLAVVNGPEFICL